MKRPYSSCYIAIGHNKAMAGYSTLDAGTVFSFPGCLSSGKSRGSSRMPTQPVLTARMLTGSTTVRLMGRFSHSNGMGSS